LRKTRTNSPAESEGIRLQIYKKCLQLEILSDRMFMFANNRAFLAENRSEPDVCTNIYFLTQGGAYSWQDVQCVIRRLCSERQ